MAERCTSKDRPSETDKILFCVQQSVLGEHGRQSVGSAYVMSGIGAMKL